MEGKFADADDADGDDMSTMSPRGDPAKAELLVKKPAGAG